MSNRKTTAEESSSIRDNESERLKELARENRESHERVKESLREAERLAQRARESSARASA